MLCAAQYAEGCREWTKFMRRGVRGDVLRATLYSRGCGR